MQNNILIYVVSSYAHKAKTCVVFDTYEIYKNDSTLDYVWQHKVFMCANMELNSILNCILLIRLYRTHHLKYIRTDWALSMKNDINFPPKLPEKAHNISRRIYNTYTSSTLLFQRKDLECFVKLWNIVLSSCCHRYEKLFPVSF